MSEAQTYHDSLIAQGYSAADAVTYTQQHFPDFSNAAPIAAAPMASPQVMTGMVNVQQQVIITESVSDGGGIRITNGVLGILMSLAMIGYSLFIIGMWEDLGTELENTLKELGYEEGTSDEADDFFDSVDSFLATISLLYMFILFVSIVVLVFSVIQFMNKPWGTKALLCSTGILLVLLLATAMYEVSSINQILDDSDELSGENKFDESEFSIFEVNGMIGAYCTGLCFFLYALLAFIGRPKGTQAAPVVLQQPV